MAKGRHTLQNGRSSAEQFVPLGYPMLHSEAWRSLSGGAIKVFLELRSRYNGENNGKLCLSFTDASRLLALGKATVKRAYAELVEKGFIRLAKKGHWYGRHANEWAVTDRSCQGHLASNDWKRWRQAPPKTERGSITEHISPQYVPNWNRETKICSVLEPVRRVSGG